MGDAELVSGSPDGFTVLFDRHAAALHRYCARRVGADLADDLVSETYLTAFRARHRFDPARGQALPWLYGICTNLLRRHRRDEARAYKMLARTGVDPLATTDGTDRSLDRVEASMSSRALAGALAALPAKQRDVLLLFAVADLSYPEIAAALSIPDGTVRSRLSRARNTVRTHLTRSLPNRSAS
ncbi:DNA-directed RNA polymerase sigma-70 factor [Actinorhabdospora filicis]|uniref:DNA-directed RNA polymerase sigma-70 factor n=1 Tax=Actinorhabdospora filicis TaxID=1785913 RepID=A0A9W6SK51_9ACTN|nr:DNA-directed RNA polymerase sigma-70 factor [Actinorhabdospora filicis]